MTVRSLVGKRSKTRCAEHAGFKLCAKRVRKAKADEATWGGYALHEGPTAD